MKTLATCTGAAFLLIFSGSALAGHNHMLGELSHCKSNFTTMNPQTHEMETFIGFHLVTYNHRNHRVVCHYRNDTGVHVKYVTEAHQAVGPKWGRVGRGMYECPMPIKPMVYSGHCQFRL